jgi:hypothetical protein
MGNHRSFITTKKSRSTIKTVTKTVVVPGQKEGEDINSYYLRLKKLGLRLPKK